MVSALRWTLWGTGGLTLLLGLLLWSGNGYALTSLHIGLGIVVVLTLWALAGLALSRGSQRGLAVTALLWGLITPVIGILQTRLLPGSSHILIQLVHLVLGAGAIAIGNRLATTTPQRFEQPLRSQ